jgi:hypothetical protein
MVVALVRLEPFDIVYVNVTSAPVRGGLTLPETVIDSPKAISELEISNLRVDSLLDAL